MRRLAGIVITLGIRLLVLMAVIMVIAYWVQHSR